MNDYLKKLITDQENSESFYNELMTYKTCVKRSRLKIKLYLVATLLFFTIVDITIGIILYSNYIFTTFLSIFIPFQLSFFIFYLFFIKKYIIIRRKTNIFLENLVNTDHVYAMYRQQWKKLKMQNQVSLNLSKLVLNNVSGITRFFIENEYSLKDGGVFDENFKGINSVIFYDDNWKVTYYSIPKNARFDSMFYPFIAGNVTLANKSHRTKFTDKQAYNSHKLENYFKSKKHKFATFINFKFADKVNWKDIKNSFRREDLRYLSSRGIYIKIGNKDLSFCFLETSNQIFTPGVYLFNKDHNLLKTDLHINGSQEKIYEYIDKKIEHDLNNFLSKYLMIIWFVQKYRKKTTDKTSYLIERLKNDFI